MRISEAEFAGRREAFAARLEERGLAGAVLFDAHYILYYTGFAFVRTERPIAFVVTTDGRAAMLVPRLEVEHAAGNVAVDEVAHYDEYPGDRHPMDFLQDLLERLGVRGALGADHDGYPWIYGYRGPALGNVTNVTDVIEDQMMIKSEAEIALLRESSKWSNLATTLLQRYAQAGMTETEVSQRANVETTRALLDAIGPIYRPQSPFPASDGAAASFGGQIGRNAALPHALANDVVLEAGNVAVAGVTVPVWGYYAELERTMVVGAASDEQRRLFEHMLALQEIGFETIRAGARCAEVDNAVRAYYNTHGLWDCWRHHVGHAIGLRYHEAPFLDRGDTTEIRPGMVFTVEPGLYSSVLGGFRHSDTVAVTDDGLEFLTYYPRDLDSLTIPA